jgi:hypothetical protein
MKIYVDGKEIEFQNDVRIVYEIEPDVGITNSSDCEIVLNCEGMVLDVVEVTERSCPSAESTRTGSLTVDELINMFVL